MIILPSETSNLRESDRIYNRPETDISNSSNMQLSVVSARGPSRMQLGGSSSRARGPSRGSPGMQFNMDAEAAKLMPSSPAGLKFPSKFTKDPEPGKWEFSLVGEVAKAPDNFWHRSQKVLITLSREKEPQHKCLCSYKSCVSSESKMSGLCKWGVQDKSAKTKLKGKVAKAGGGPTGGIGGGGAVPAANASNAGEKVRKGAPRVIQPPKFQHNEDLEAYLDKYRKCLHPATSQTKLAPDPYRDKLRNMG